MAGRTTKDEVTVRLDDDQRAELDALVRLRSRNRSFLINEAIESYLAMHRWQIARIVGSLHQADAGDFASPEQVEAGYARWM